MQVKRQKNIENYIVDFYIPSAKIAIELDGGQHGISDNKEKDRQRDEAIGKWEITVLRYTNQDINTKFNAVCEDILKHLGLGAKDMKY